MAIPFNLPTDEETEDNYRRLDQLLLDLYHVLRQILLRPRSDTSANRDTGGGGGGGGDRPAAPAPSRSRPVDDVTGTHSRRHRHRLDPAVLPDVVSSTLDCACPCVRNGRRSQRRYRRRRQECCDSVDQGQSHNSSTPQTSRQSRESPSQSQVQCGDENWLIVGEHLRKIAEEFKTSIIKEEYAKEKNEDLKMEVKTSGLFSLLVPAHFRSSIWTTVILLVGWRLLVRTR